MNRTKRIKNIISSNFLNWEVKVQDNSFMHNGHNGFDGSEETHLLIILKLQSINNDSRLSIHRKINNLLKKEFELGLHSLEIQILI